MANRKSSITAELKLNGQAKFKSDLNEASRASRVFGKSLESIGGKGIGSSMKFTELHSGLQLAGSAARMAGAAFKSAFSRDMKVEQLAMALSSVSDGTETLAQQFAALKEAAKLPGLGFTEIAQGSLDLQSVGVSAEQSREAIIQLGNALASTGKGKAELEGITTALAQMYGKGKVSAEEINQIAERYPAIRSIASTLDKTSPSKFTEGLTEALSKLPRATGTAQDGIDNLNDAVDQLMTTATGGALNQAVKSLTQGAANALGGNGFGDGMEKLGRGVRGMMDGAGVNPLAKFELSPEEVTKRQAAKKAAADAELAAKEAILDAEMDLAFAEQTLAQAQTDRDDEEILKATEQIALLKEKKKLMESVGISDQRATEFIRQRVALEQVSNNLQRDSERAENRKKEARGLGELEAQAGGMSDRRFKKLQKGNRLAEEEERLVKDGVPLDEAKKLASRKVEAEDRIQQDQDRASMGLRPRIRGSGYKGDDAKRRRGIGSSSYEGLESLRAMNPRRDDEDPMALPAQAQERRTIRGAGAAPKTKDQQNGSGVAAGIQSMAAELKTVTNELRGLRQDVKANAPGPNERGKPISSTSR